jgi:hypothetical protein
MKYSYLAICLLIAFFVKSHADKEFENEVYENLSKFVQDYRSLRTVPDVKKYIPERAGLLIDYAKRYFNGKTLMTNEAPKVNVIFLKGVSSKPSGKYILGPDFCLLS